MVPHVADRHQFLEPAFGLRLQEILPVRTIGRRAPTLRGCTLGTSPARGPTLLSTLLVVSGVGAFTLFQGRRLGLARVS